MKRTTICMFAGLIAATATSVPMAAHASESFIFGTPSDGLVFASSGYSGVLRGGYMTPLGESFNLGAEFILDAGLFNSTGAGAPGTITIAGGAPMSFVFWNTDQFVLGMRATPGLGVTLIDAIEVVFENGFPSRTEETTEPLFALLLHVNVNFGYKLMEALTLGGGVDIPLTVLIGEFNGAIIPVLFGPTAEYQITDAIAVAAEFKLGPHAIVGEDAISTTQFGLKFAAYGVYRF